MKKVFTLLFAVLCAASFLRSQNVEVPQASKKASVSEWIGLTQVTVDYHRPGVKGREGKVFGEGGLVPYPDSHRDGKPMPWRAGANENTTIYFQDDVTIEGRPLKAGKYGFHVIPAESEWTLIFSNNNYSWGSFFYKPEQDALRVPVKVSPCEFTEWLSYDFVNETDNSADVRLRWEHKQITFKVETDAHAVTMASIKRELDGAKGFSQDAYVSAAQYCLQAGKDMDQALAWADKAMDPSSVGLPTFQTLSTKAQILDKMGKTADAKAIMDRALPLGTMTEVHFYGRTLIDTGKPEEAMKVFKMNREKNPNDNFTTLVGMARGSMALGKYKDAAQYFRQAAPNAPQGQTPLYESLANECDAKVKAGG